MYITETTNSVRKIIESFDEKNDLRKLNAMIYIFEKVDNGQVNSENITNPYIGDHDDLEIFNFVRIGLTHNTCEVLIQFLCLVYRGIYNVDVNYIDSHVEGLEYNDEDKELISSFEKLTYNEKLDVISELIIRYDNNTMFKEHHIHMPFKNEIDGFEWARLIQNLKK